MEANLDEIARELATLTQRFVDLGTSLDEAARALEEVGVPPGTDLVEALAAARGQFVELRAQTLTAAAAAGVPPPSEPETLNDLEPVLTAISEALQARARRQALEQAQQSATATLDRALALIHGDDPNFSALVACHAGARQLRAAVMELTELESDAARQVVEGVRVFADLLTIVEHRDALDDDQYAALDDRVSRAFGRALAMAASRARLGFEGDFPEPSPPEPAPVTAESLEIDSPLDQTDAAPSGPEAPLVMESAALGTEAGEPDAEPESESGLALGPLTVAEAPATAEPGSSAGGPDETAQWWLAAWTRWSGWKSTHDFPSAVREELGKYPYLLSVPIRTSPAYEDGLLAYGYSILMAHVEKHNRGCVGNALNRLKPGPNRPIGEQLYDYLIAEGRLGETYADFVEDALAAAVPEPGVWFQFRILESKDDTRIFQRPTGRIGDTELSGQRLAGEAQRYSEHTFKMTLAPLTTRFVLVSADVREPRGAGFKVAADGAACDSGWVASVPVGARASATTDVKRISEDGLHVPGLGKDYAALWAAVFNPDPRADRRYELSVFLRKDARSPFRTTG